MAAFSGHIGSAIGLTRCIWLIAANDEPFFHAFKECMLACGDRISAESI